MGRRFADQIGEDAVVETHVGACGGKHDRFVQLARRQRGQDVCARRDQRTEPGVFEGSIEQVRPHGGDEPHVDGGVVDGTQDDVDERITVVDRRSGPTLLELVDHDDHPSEMSSDVVDRVDRDARAVEIGHGGDLAEADAEGADADRRRESS